MQEWMTLINKGLFQVNEKKLKKKKSTEQPLSKKIHLVTVHDLLPIFSLTQVLVYATAQIWEDLKTITTSELKSEAQ